MIIVLSSMCVEREGERENTKKIVPDRTMGLSLYDASHAFYIRTRVSY
jgi:hypothetical protein